MTWLAVFVLQVVGLWFAGLAGYHLACARWHRFMGDAWGELGRRIRERKEPVHSSWITAADVDVAFGPDNPRRPR